MLLPPAQPVVPHTPFGPLQVAQSSIGARLRIRSAPGEARGVVRRDPMAYKVVPPGCPSLSYPP